MANPFLSNPPQMAVVPFGGMLAGWSILADMFRGALNNWSLIRIDYAGDRNVESAVTSSVASFGRQLGILEEAVLELAHAAGGDNEKVKRLEEMMQAIEWIKKQQQTS